MLFFPRCLKIKEIIKSNKEEIKLSISPEVEKELESIRIEVEKEISNQKVGYEVLFGEEFLSKEEKVKLWYAKAVAGAVISDGEISKNEIEYLKIAIDFITREQYQSEIRPFLDSKELPLLNSIDVLDPAFSERAFVTITRIIAADNKVTRSEIDYLRSVGKSLGYGNQKILKAISLCFSMVKQNKISQEINILMDQFKSLD